MCQFSAIKILGGSSYWFMNHGTVNGHVSSSSSTSRKTGHQTHAPTLSGHGPRQIQAGINHPKCVDAIDAYIQHQGLKEVTPVGHGFGEAVIQPFAEQLQDRIARVVFFHAPIVADQPERLRQLTQRLMSVMDKPIHWKCRKDMSRSSGCSHR